MTIETIFPKQLQHLSDGGNQIDVIDVRTPVEYREIHAEIARNIPLDRLDPAEVMESRNDSRDRPLYFICQSGSRAKQACEKFVAAGFSNVVKIEGGTVAWEEAGLPMIRGKKAISLERQVRIAAGFLVLLGAGLGFFVHPYFVGISAFIGAGLMIAGITDTCGMAMLLSRMPWNQVPDCNRSQ